MSYVIVFIGGGIGSVLRYAASRAGLALVGPDFPAGTLFVNVVGSTAMGIVVAWFAWRGAEPSAMRLLIATGILGGFTTFSAFSLDAVLLWQRGEVVAATLYVLASLVVSIGGLVAGMVLTRLILTGG